jgi:hypothetical protein
LVVDHANGKVSEGIAVLLAALGLPVVSLVVALVFSPAMEDLLPSLRLAHPHT